MPRWVAVAVGCGVLAALFFLSVRTGSPGALILVYMVQLPLFVAGLWYGTTAVLVAGSTAAVTTAIGGSLLSGLFFIGIEALPVAILVRQALLSRADDKGELHWYPPGRLVLILVGFGVVALMIGLAFASGDGAGPAEAVREFLREELVRFLLSAQPAMPPEQAAVVAVRMAAMMSSFFPAMAVDAWLLMVALNAILAQGLLSRFGVAFRPSPGMAEIGLPSWVPLVVAGTGALAMFAGGTTGFLALNVLLVVSMGLFFAGLAVIHVGVRRFGAGTLVLVAFYVIMTIFGWPILLVIGLGLMEQWVGLRHRLTAAAPGQGE